MNKLTLALVIAQNGLRAAASLLNADATKNETKAGTATGDEAAKLKKKAARQKKLAAALSAADAGITTYLSEAEA